MCPGPAGRLPCAGRHACPGRAQRLPATGKPRQPSNGGANPGCFEESRGGLRPCGVLANAPGRCGMPCSEIALWGRSRPAGICLCLCTWLLTWRARRWKACTGGRQGGTDGQKEGCGLGPSSEPWEIRKHRCLSD